VATTQPEKAANRWIAPYPTPNESETNPSFQYEMKAALNF